MEEVRQLVQEEGREARNLVAFHVAVDTPGRVARKPPRATALLPRRAPPRPTSRLRSASTGRDKRSELRARYWAMLFGDLQRAVGEIYNTVEANENQNECQEVILVLENYTRDFKALGEWFRLKWDYDNTPPPQRPQSLVWEIRKTDFVGSETKRQSVKSSPSASGKNSPCLSGYNTPSGKNSPNLTGKASPSGKISPRILGHSSSTSPKANVEFFNSKITSVKNTAKPDPKTTKELSRLSDIKEKDAKDSHEGNLSVELSELQDDVEVNIDLKMSFVEKGKAKEYPNVSPKQVVIKSKKMAQMSKEISTKTTANNEEIYNQVKSITDKLDSMENDFLSKQFTESIARNDNLLNTEKQCDDKKNDQEKLKESPCISKDNFTDISNKSPEKDENIKVTVTEENELLDTTDDIDKKVHENSLISEDTDVTCKNKNKSNTIGSSQLIQSNKENKIISEITKKPVISDIHKESEIDQRESFDDASDKKEIGHSVINVTEYELKENDIKNIKQEFKNLDLEVVKDEIKIPETKDNENETKKSVAYLESKKLEPKIAEQEAKKFDIKIEQELKKNETKVAIETKPNPKPAYSQAAAKPKVLNASKIDVKPATSRSTTPLTRSRTVVEMKPNTTSKSQKQFTRRNQPSKCSYPFNLTTGRTTLFDTAPSANFNKGTLSKKPLNKNIGMGSGSGDAKPVLKKVDMNKRAPPPTTLKISGKGDKKDKANPVLEKIKDCEEYSSTDTIVTQIDISRIESNESLKTLVPEELQMTYDVTNSLEVLNVNGNKNDDDGWLTVKSRRLSRESKKQSKSHWANRFHQPSATTSLPTLNMMESPKQEAKPIINTSAYVEVERAKSEQPKLDISVNVDSAWARSDPSKLINPDASTKADTEKSKSERLQHVLTEKPSKFAKVTSKPNLESKVKNGPIIRQKSDVTGLKSRSARNKALTKRTEKAKDSRKQDEMSELTKNRLHSSLESLTMGLSRSQESTEEVFDFDKWKAEFKTTFKYLDDDDQVPNDTELLKTADPSEMSEIAEMTSQIEENERRLGWALDFQSEVDQRKLCEEEDLLNRQIMELQQVSDIDIDTETDETETDAEIICEDNSADTPSCASSENLGSLAASLEDQYETALAGMSWAERVDTLVVLEALVARDPGRAQQLHAKLSQGIKRRGSLQDALRRLQAKQARAERQRLNYQTERAKRIHQLLARVEEVKVAKNQLIEEKRLRMERRLQRAAENRDQYLKDIVRKAHDEEEKLKEIAFIKQLEAENRRHDFLDQCRSHTTRLRQMRRDRLRKLEQKAAREAAVGARRQALEEARRLHVETLLEKKKERDARVDQLNQLKKQERDDAAREKAEGVKSRLSALAAAAELEADALRSRIRDKQDASQQRLESHLQAIREKATGPRQATTSESQDQCTKELEEEVDRFEQEKKEKDKLKAIKKKARKVRQKLLSAGHSGMFDESAIATESFMNPVSSRMSKAISQINYIIVPLAQLLSKEIKGKCCNNPNCDEYGTEKNNMKNTNNIVNGNTEQAENKKKSKKKKNTEDNLGIMKENGQNDKIEINNIQNDKKALEKNSPKETQVMKIDTNSQELVSNDTMKNENGKKKKKNKNKEHIELNNEKNRLNDKPKLSKASSICSSISDTSKASNKVDKKTKIDIDASQLERQLNELFRLVEKFGKSAADKTTYQKLQGLKCLGQLLAVVAERDDLATQFTAKSVSTAVSIISVWVGGCCGSAAYLLSTNTCVHLVKLLSDQMEKDLQLDHKEMELAKQLSDSLSIALDSVLCSTRLYEEGKEKEKMEKSGEDLELLTTLRGRAHTLISYLCLSGCVGRAERAGEARESIQTVLTVCADLCHPCDIDVGTERTSAQQSLRCALGTSLCGSRAEFCILFAKGAGIEECRDFVRAARTTHLLRAIAEMDHQIVQESFGEGGWPLEFRAAVARLLSQHAPSEKEAPRSTTFTGCEQRLDQSLSETMVLDLIVLVGFVVVNNPQLQETICDGWSVVKTLCTLPANWLVSRTHSHALLPTLTALAERQGSPERATIASELSLQMLEDYLECPEAQKVKLVQVIKQARSKRLSGKK